MTHLPFFSSLRLSLRLSLCLCASAVAFPVLFPWRIRRACATGNPDDSTPSPTRRARAVRLLRRRGGVGAVSRGRAAEGGAFGGPGRHRPGECAEVGPGPAVPP